MMDDYLLFYKTRLLPAATWARKWDVFISAYNSSERVLLVADRVKCREQHWVILPEYAYKATEYPAKGRIHVAAPNGNEADFATAFLESLGVVDLAAKRILIDITGFLINYLLTLTAMLQRVGIQEYDIIYSEPVRYLQSERTRFSDETVLSVRQVAGFEGVHTVQTNEDLLVLGVGYDGRLVAEVANDKEHARKIQLFGLPSLQPDMYQENLIRAYSVAESVGPDASLPQHYVYAPANDPFITASVLSGLVARQRREHPESNIYLTPLSTKAQALGFGLFYLRECMRTPTSIIYPFCKAHMRETSEGLAGAWLFHMETRERV